MFQMYKKMFANIFFPNATKRVRGQKNFKIEQKMCKGTPNESKVLSSMTHYVIEFPCLTWMALCGLVWSCMASLLPYMGFYGRLSSFLAVIDPKSFGLVPSEKGILMELLQFTRLQTESWQKVESKCLWHFSLINGVFLGCSFVGKTDKYFNEASSTSKEDESCHKPYNKRPQKLCIENFRVKRDQAYFKNKWIFRK